MNNITKIEKQMKFEHKIDIKTTPERIWEFLLDIDKNYVAWHPGDHILFRWTKGQPFETGSTFYAEQKMMNRKIKYNGKITECIPKNKILKC